MEVETMIRRCVYCKSVGGFNVHISQVEKHDLIVISCDFETQKVLETDFVCECCLRNDIPALKKRTEELLGIA